MNDTVATQPKADPNRRTFETDRLSVTVTRYTDIRRQTPNTKAYLWDVPDPDLPTPPYGVKGENVDDDKAWRRYNRAELVNQRAILTDALQVLAENGVYAWADIKPGFSRKTGCGCGCSPGFRLGTRLAFDGFGPKGNEYGTVESVFVTVKPVPELTAAPEPERTYTMADFDTAQQVTS